MASRKSQPTPLTGIVADIVGKKLDRAGPGAHTLRVFRAFETIGPPVTDYAEPIGLRKQVLTLRVGQPPWMTELAFLEKEIVRRINTTLGTSAIERVQFRLGPLRRTSRASSKPRSLTSEEQGLAEAWVAPITLPKVREAVLSAAQKYIARGPVTARYISGPPGPLPAPDPPPSEDPSSEELTYGYGHRTVDRWQLSKTDKPDN